MGPEGTWHERKRQRSIDYWRAWSVKMDECAACSGSGRHDSRGSPVCDACDGKGRVRGRLDSVERATRSVDSHATYKRNVVELKRAHREGRKRVLQNTRYEIKDSSAK